MCRAVRCKTCSKTTWAGCGQHVARVRAGVPAGQWCRGGHSAADRAAAAGSSDGGGFFRRVFSRS
ncbi:MAG: hypothetical protein ABI776_07955 [Nocardioidaceae bacterium]